MSPAPFNVSPVSALDDAPPFRRDVTAPLFARSPGRAAGGPVAPTLAQKLCLSQSNFWDMLQATILDMLPRKLGGISYGN